MYRDAYKPSLVFSSQAACLLAEGLQANTSLRVLGLGGCPIGNLGFAAIAAALHQSECDVEYVPIARHDKRYSALRNFLSFGFDVEP
jgi:hypothetical protein